MTRLTETQELVNKFWELHGQLGSYAKAWSAARTWFEERARQRGKDPGQTWAATSGRAFEEISQTMIIEQVRSNPLAADIRVARWDETDQAIRHGILAERVWPKGRIEEPEAAESKVDVVAFVVENQKVTRVISVYSCKSSVAERYQQDLFWAEKLRSRGVKFSLVTIDEGFINYATSPQEPRGARGSKTVPLAQALYDRIYVLTESQIVRGQAVFRHVSELVEDLELWLRAY